MVSDPDSPPGAARALADASGSRSAGADIAAPGIGQAPGSSADPAIRRIQLISRWLDDRYIDPILGFLLPGFGDALPAIFGFYVLVTAVRRRVPRVVLARMMLNIAVDVLLGAIPILGDLFDVGFKANRRNAALLVQRHGERRGRAGDWLLVGGAALLLVAVMALPIVLVLWLAASARDALFS